MPCATCISLRKGFAGWLQSVEEHGGKITLQDQEKLAAALSASAPRILAAFEKFDSMGDLMRRQYAQMEFSEYKVLRRLLVGKKNLRRKFEELVANSLLQGNEGVGLSAEELAELKLQIGSLNADIETSHDKLVARLAK